MTRPVRISTISLYLPTEKMTIEQNLDKALLAVRAAINEKPDIILLPEFFIPLGTDPDVYAETVNQTADRYQELLKPFQEIAQTSKTWIVLNGPKRENGSLYNVCTVINRQGEVTGLYRKTHLAPGEEKLITAGDTYPVFETDFGKIACMICMDIHYPEIARIYALRGAEILFWPTMSWGPTDRALTVLLAARSIDNQIYSVHSNFAGLPFLPGKPRGRACIIGLDGEARADTGHRPGIATATVDLDEPYEYWVTGSLKGKLPTLKEPHLGLRRPDTYGDLVDEEIPWDAWQISTPHLISPHKPGEEDDSIDFLFANND